MLHIYYALSKSPINLAQLRKIVLMTTKFYHEEKCVNISNEISPFDLGSRASRSLRSGIKTTLNCIPIVMLWAQINAHCLFLPSIFTFVHVLQRLQAATIRFFGCSILFFRYFCIYVCMVTLKQFAFKYTLILKSKNLKIQM